MYHHGRASGDDQCTIMEGRVEMTNVPSWKGEWRLPMYPHGKASGDDQCTIMEGRVEMTNVPSWKGEWR